MLSCCLLNRKPRQQASGMQLQQQHLASAHRAGGVSRQACQRLPRPGVSAAPAPPACNASPDAAAAAAAAAAEAGRRQLLLASSVALLAPLLRRPGPAVAGEQPAAASSSAAVDLPLQPYVNAEQQYRLSVPSSWERKDKAGADVLFEDPARRSTSVGVTVSPVRVASIDQFGDLDAVGRRLLDVERRKESTLGVSLLSSSCRSGGSGALLYEYEYELNSSRGTKRILNTVTITGSKLFILNAAFKCDKEAGCAGPNAAAPIGLLRRVAASFDAGSSD